MRLQIFHVKNWTTVVTAIHLAFVSCFRPIASRIAWRTPASSYIKRRKPNVASSPPPAARRAANSMSFNRKLRLLVGMEGGFRPALRGFAFTFTADNLGQRNLQAAGHHQLIALRGSQSYRRISNECGASLIRTNLHAAFFREGDLPVLRGWRWDTLSTG